MSSDEFQKRAETVSEKGRPLPQTASVRRAAEGKKSAPEQKYPGEKRKIVGGKEAGPGKSQDHHENALIQKIGKGAQAQAFKTEIPGRHIPCQEKEKETADQAGRGRNACEKGIKQRREQYRKAEKA